ncbi:MAG: MFS transporter [Candidatus Latescibacteria bacterium]|nr:MFS transporter [Candidatus Latescibacterota bacterium]
MTGTRYARYVLLLLTLINLFNYLDRYVVLSLFTPIKQELGVSDLQLGLLETVVEVVLAVATIPMGIASDIGSRKTIIGTGLLLWSLMTAAGGLVTSYRQLFLCRFLIGIGESSYAPSATALIAEYFPSEKRARAIGVFSAGMGFGGMLGFIVGGIVAHYLGWRYALFLVGLPGLCLAVAVWRLRESNGRPRHVRASEHGEMPGLAVSTNPGVDGWWELALTTLRNGLATLYRTPTLLIVFLGGTFIIFAVNGLITWGVSYMNRYLGFSLMKAGLVGGLGVIGVVMGNLSGGMLGDWFLRRTKAGRVIVAGSGFLIGTPFCLAAISSVNEGVVIGSLLMSLFLFTWYNGPLTATILDIVPVQFKATIMACYNCCVHLLGAALAPLIIGRLSDIYGLDDAIVVLPLVAFLGGLIILTASWTITRDMARVTPAGEF